MAQSEDGDDGATRRVLGRHDRGSGSLSRDYFQIGFVKPGAQVVEVPKEPPQGCATIPPNKYPCARSATEARSPGSHSHAV